MADFLCHRACRSAADMCNDCKMPCMNTTDPSERGACELECESSHGGPCGLSSLSSATQFTNCGAVDYEEDKWGSSALCVDKNRCSELCSMVSECKGIVASDYATRCYIVSSDCSPRPLKYFYAMEYIPNKGETLTCPAHPPNRQLGDSSEGPAPLLSKGEFSGGPRTFGEDVADDGFDVAAAVREGMFAAVDDADFE